MRRKRPQLIVIPNKHHGRISSDFTEDGLHISHRCTLSVQLLEDVSQRSQFLDHDSLDISHFGKLDSQAVKYLLRLFCGFGKTGSHGTQGGSCQGAFQTHISQQTDGGTGFRKVNTGHAKVSGCHLVGFSHLHNIDV